MKKYRVLEDFGNLKEGDIVVENETKQYLYTTDKVATTIWTIEKNPDKFQLLDL